MLISVWETSVPSTTGRFSRGRPLRRATISAREGSPSRAGRVEDMSTPMNVPCIASDIRTRALGMAALRIACQDTARIAIAPHINPSPSTTNDGLDASSADAMLLRPILLRARTASSTAPSDTAANAARRASETHGLRRGPERRLETGQALGGHVRLEIGGPRPDGHGSPRADRLRLRGGDRVGVGGQDLGGDPRPGEALDVGGGGARHLDPSPRLLVEVAQRLGQRLGVGGRNEHAVDPVAHDVAVAGDVGGDDRGAGGKRLGEHHAEALAAQRGRAQDVGALQLGRLALVVDLAQRAYAAIVDEQRGEFLARRADHGQLARDVLAQRLEGPQQQRQALALDRLADEHDPQTVVALGPATAPAGPRAPGRRDRRGPRWGSPGSDRRRTAGPSTRPPPRRRSARAAG